MTALSRPAAVDGWLHMVHDETGGTQRVPETLTDADLEYWQARGWSLVDAPEPGPFVPVPVNVNPGEVPAEWVELVHPVTGARHDFPNNPDALQGAGEAGWVPPNRDGSIPKRAMAKAARDEGVPVDELPSAAVEQGEAATEEPAGEIAEQDEQAESSATDQEE